MDLENLKEVLEEVWKSPMDRVEESDEEAKQQPKQKKTFFLGEKAVKPQNPVIFSNGVFFVERAPQFLVIRPKTVKEYLRKVRGTERTIKIQRAPKEILIPLPQTRENPIKWFEERYVEQSRKRNQQGRFIKEIWKYRNEVFKGVMMG